MPKSIPTRTARLGPWLVLGTSAWLAGAARPAPPVGADQGRIQFEDRQPGSGIAFVPDNGTTPDKPIIDGVLGGVAVLDFDNDGGWTCSWPTAPEYLVWRRTTRDSGTACSTTKAAGLFSDVSGSTGIGAHVGKGMSVAVADADADGFTDVFVANDEMRHFLFRNESGRLFAETGVEAGVAFTEDGVPVSGMGTDFRDINEDGRPDILLTALSGYSFPLYLNTPERFFVPSSHAAGLRFATALMGGWGTGAYDLDNDGKVLHPRREASGRRGAAGEGPGPDHRPREDRLSRRPHPQSEALVR